VEERRMKLWLEAAFPIIIGVVISLLVLLMRGILSAVIGLPLYLLIIIALIPAVIIFSLASILVKIYTNGKEGFTFMKARNDGLPVLVDIEIGTNKADFVIGEKENEKSIVFKDDASGVKVDPGLVSAYAEPLRFEKGLEVYGYAYHNWLPQTTKNHLAFKAIVDYRKIDKEMPELDFLPDKEFVELISKPEHFLEADLKTKIGKYYKSKKSEDGEVKYFRQYEEKGHWFEEEVSIPEVTRLINKAKVDITNLPICTGYFSMNEAFKNNSVAYSAQHLAQLKILIEQQAEEKWRKMQDWMKWGMIIVAIIVAGGVSVYIASMAIQKMGGA
jgi:hypothetical protein